MRQTVRDGCGRLAYLGLTGSLLAGRSAIAQEPPPASLTVRPHAMATGTQTARAGEQPLEGFDEYLVYVPASCVGTRRCPLVVFLHEVSSTPKQAVESQRPFADQYGMILLAPQAEKRMEGVEAKRDYFAGGDRDEAKQIDAAMKQVLGTYAIDGDKVALVGDKGMIFAPAYALSLGCVSVDAFSRVASMSVWLPSEALSFPCLDQRQLSNTKAQYYLTGGLSEFDFAWASLQIARQLRHQGATVQHVLALRGYQIGTEDYARMWQWLQESWAAPRTAPRAAPRAGAADSLPVLTPEALAQLTAFWTRFQQEPDSIRTTARQTHQVQRLVPIGEELVPVWSVDMPALAAKYPSVAAALQAAGLTAQQHDAYRLALISASATRQAEGVTAPVGASSALGQNLAFLRAHKSELVVLGATGMWVTP